MKKKIIFTFIGGDKRQKNAIHILAQEGFQVKVYGFAEIIHENVEVFDVLDRELFDCHVLMLPIPYKNNQGLVNVQQPNSALKPELIFSMIHAGTMIILGKADQEFMEYAEANELPYYDIVDEETFSILNAVPSAEGAIQRAMERTDITLHEANVLILGYGRIGKVLARMLKGLGAFVTVEARKNEDLAWIREAGYHPVHLDEMDQILHKQDVIFNTIPAMVLDRGRLSKVHSRCVVVDLASHPGGTDFDAAADFGIDARLDLSLPGIVAPMTAARIICQVTREILQRHFHYDIMGG